MNRHHRIATLLLALPGLAAPFLPFVLDTSPLETLAWLLRWRREPIFALLGAPFFLAIVIAFWQARRLLASRLSSFEIASAFALSAVGMISVLAFTVLELAGIDSVWDAQVWVTFGPCWALLVANTALLARNVSMRSGREATVEMFLLGGYLPNAVFCLLMFGWKNWKVLQLGALATAIACVSYLVSIGLVLRTERQ